MHPAHNNQRAQPAAVKQNPTTPATPRVVIVGAGFAGLTCARKLKHAHAEVTLIDKHNHHLFQPLLYQVATAALSPSDIATPIRTLLRKQANARVLLDEVTRIDAKNRSLSTQHGLNLEYDYLVLATGARISYFGNEQSWPQYAPGLKTIKDALRIREQFLEAFELAETEPDPQLRNALLTFVIVGGGPTGVELAGTIAEIASVAIPPDYRRIGPHDARVILVQGGEALLPAYPPPLQQRAKADLESVGVHVRLGQRAERINDECVTLSNGEKIHTRNVFWGAGVAPSPLGQQLGLPTADDGRVTVGNDLTPDEHPELFVAGDLAQATDANGNEPPGIAAAAIQMGAYAAKRITDETNNRAPPSHDRPPFTFRDKGQLATIGRGKAVGIVAKKQLVGYPAWLIWLAVHVIYLIGFRNRVLVLIQWAYAYVFWQRGARIITDTRTARQHTAIHHPNASYALPSFDQPAH